MKLIAGLGNPGAEYAGTRHNIGFEVIEELSRRHHIPVTRRNFQSVYGDGQIGGQKVLLVRPMTYMNLSGQAVSAIAHFFKIPPGDILIILDDVALPAGQIRLRTAGSSGGHNGLENILRHLRTQSVPRVRIGIGAPRPGQMVGHVLSRFHPEEEPLIAEAIQRAADAVECILCHGFETAMQRFNTRRERSRPDNASPLPPEENPQESS